jgi:hypothetical protein
MGRALEAAARAEKSSGGEGGDSEDGTDHSGFYLRTIVCEREGLFRSGQDLFIEIDVVPSREDEVALHRDGGFFGSPFRNGIEDFLVSRNDILIPLAVTAVDVGVFDGAFLQSAKDGGEEVMLRAGRDGEVEGDVGLAEALPVAA